MAMIDFRKDRKSVNMGETENVTEGSAPSPLGRRCGSSMGLDAAVRPAQLVLGARAAASSPRAVVLL